MPSCHWVRISWQENKRDIMTRIEIARCVGGIERRKSIASPRVIIVMYEADIAQKGEYFLSHYNFHKNTT